VSNHARYSISQKSGGSHEDDEPPLYDLVVCTGDTQLKLCRGASYSEAVELAHKHAKHYGYRQYFVNGRFFNKP